MASITSRISWGCTASLMRLQLVHELFIDVETAGSIQDQDIIAVVPGMQDRLAGDFHRVALPHLKHRHAGLFTDDLQLLDRSRTIDVTGCQQRTLAALLEIPGQLGTVGGLTGTLKAAHHDDGGDLRREGDPGVGGTHQFGQFVIDDLDDLLGGSQALKHFDCPWPFHSPMPQSPWRPCS